MTKLTGPQIADEKLTGWAHLGDGLQTRIATPDFAAGLALLNTIGAAAEEADHHPDVDLRYTSVNIRLTSHDVGRVTKRDVRMARRIDEIVAAAGLTTDPVSVSRLEIGLDSPDAAAVGPFWASVLGGEFRSGDDDPEVRDEHDVTPPIWFQQSGADEPRQRWHFDVWIEPSQVQTRIDAALAAGGTLVSDAHAPRFWVLADAEGNKMCFCASHERE